MISKQLQTQLKTILLEEFKVDLLENEIEMLATALVSYFEALKNMNIENEQQSNKTTN